MNCRTPSPREGISGTPPSLMFVTELLVGRGKDTRAVTHISHPISNVSVEDGERMSKVASGAGGGGVGRLDISLVLSRVNSTKRRKVVKK